MTPYGAVLELQTSYNMQRTELLLLFECPLRTSKQVNNCRQMIEEITVGCFFSCILSLLLFNVSRDEFQVNGLLPQQMNDL